MSAFISMCPPSKMIEAKKKDEQKCLLDRLKDPNAALQPDWRREFERIIYGNTRPYGKDVDIRIEEELRIGPPRADYLILDDKKK